MVSAYEGGLELGHNEMYNPYSAGAHHPTTSLASACAMNVATKSAVVYQSWPNCGMESLGTAVYHPGYGINCMAISYCVMNGVRQEDPPSPSVSLDKVSCPALDANGQCIYWPKPLTESCSNDPHCDKPECPVGNPIYPSSGMKVQQEIDLLGSSQFGFSVTRTYTHKPKPPNQTQVSALGYWNFDLEQRRLAVGSDHSAGSFWHDVTTEDCERLKIHRVHCKAHTDLTNVIHYRTLRAFRPDGGEWVFKSELDPLGEPTSWSSRHFPAARVVTQRNENGKISGWSLTLHDGSTEFYSPGGDLQSIKPVLGLPTSVSRFIDTDGVTKVTQVMRGTQSLRFYKDSQEKVIKIVTANNQEIKYEYLPNTHLISRVVLPDNTDKKYFYENVQFPMALTSIQNELGIRYAFWEYDDFGRAFSSKHAGDVEKTLLDYSYIYDTTPKVTVTNALGKKTSYFYSTDSFRNVIRVEGQPTPNCAGANQNYTYTPEGWVASKTDWKGIKTTFSYNTQGQEINRIEAFGTQQARTTATEWHPTLRLKAKVTEHNKETTYTYDGNGLLTKQNTRSLTTP